MSTPLKALFTILLLAALACMGFSAWAVMGIRADLAALQARVSQIERRPAPEAPMKDTFGAPSTPPSASALPVPSDVEALRRQVAELSTRVEALSAGAPAAGTAVPLGPNGVAAAPGVAVVPAPAGPTFDDPTREAIKNLVRETMAEEPTTVGAISFTAPVIGGVNDIDSLAKQLGLSETQKTEIQKIWAERDKEMEGFWTGTGDLPEPQVMEAKMKELNRKTDDQIKKLLTVEQAKGYDDSRSQRGDAIFFGVKAREIPPSGK